MCFHDAMVSLCELFRGTTSFQPHRQAYCEKLPFALPRLQEVAEILSRYSCRRSTWLHKLVARSLGVFYSPSGGRITTQDWSEGDRALLERLYDDVLAKVNEWDARPVNRLHRISPAYFGKLYGLKYEGEGSRFGWHYDSLGQDEYRAIFTVKQSGRRRASFACMRREGEVETPRLESGEGVLIRSGETFHAVVPDAEEVEDGAGELQRWVLVFTYTAVEQDL